IDVGIRNYKVGGSTYLTVTGVLGEVNRLSIPGQLHKNGESRLETMLPVNCKAQPFPVKSEATPGVGDAKLWYDSLSHNQPLLWAINHPSGNRLAHLCPDQTGQAGAPTHLLIDWPARAFLSSLVVLARLDRF